MKQPLPSLPPPLLGGGLCGLGGGEFASKNPVHVVSALSVIVPTQLACCQPPNREVLLSEDGVSVTRVPARNCPWHSVPQSMPAGAEVTRPMPAPLRLTVRLTMPPI